MSNACKNREKFSSTLDKELIPLLEVLHKKTRIPKSKLYDEAISDLLDKYQIEREKK